MSLGYVFWSYFLFGARLATVTLGVFGALGAILSITGIF
jgi:hypothetical protein